MNAQFETYKPEPSYEDKLLALCEVIKVTTEALKRLDNMAATPSYNDLEDAQTKAAKRLSELLGD